MRIIVQHFDQCRSDLCTVFMRQYHHAFDSPVRRDACATDGSATFVQRNTSRRGGIAQAGKHHHVRLQYVLGNAESQQQWY